MKKTLNTMLLVAFGLLASAVAVQAQATYPDGELFIGFTIGSGNDQLYDLGQESALTNGETWNLAFLLSGYGNYSTVNWGVIGNGPNSGTPKTNWTTTVVGTAPAKATKNQFSSIYNDTLALYQNFTNSAGLAGQWVTVPASSTISWDNGTTPSAPSGSCYIYDYENPNVVGVTSAAFSQVLNDDKTITLLGTFTLAANGVVTFSTSTTSAAPVAGFTGTPTNGYAPLPVVFTDTSSGSFTNEVWNFGDGHFITNSTSTGGNVTNVYAATGNYTVTLTVSGPGGVGTNTLVNYVTVSTRPAAPAAGFTGTPTNGYAPLPVVFTDASSGTITNWLWSFGDGHSVTNGTSANVTNTYAASGNYTVTLTVTGPGGASTNTQISYVIVSNNPTAPVAGFTGSPTNGLAPLPVVFTDASSGTITNWLWNFGDGHSITNNTSANVTNLFAAAGNYTVTLTVTGPGGANTDTQTNYVTVSNPPAPVAGFTGTPTNGLAPLPVVFTDASSGTITNWLWNFGDGHSITNSTSANVTNLYAVVGNYTVKLTVAGPGGANTDTQTNYVTVSNPPVPVAGFTGTPTNGYAPLPVVFTDTSSGNITNWIWNFGNGHSLTNSISANVTNIYAAAGKYTVSLKVTGPGGANTNTKTSYVTVSNAPAPTAGFTGAPTNGYAPLPVVFTDASSGEITNWVWNFGNGHSVTNTTSDNVTNIYAAAGKYTVSLKVTGPGGANTNTKTSYVNVSGPAAGFTGNPTNGYAPLPVMFTDASSGNITNWVWNFGNGHSITNHASGTVTNIYAAAGKYTVSLEVSGPGGANTNTKTSYVTVSGPVAGFAGTPTNGFAPLQVVFSNVSSGNLTNWIWNFGNGHSLTNLTGGNVTNLYAAVGKYTVSLEVAGPGGTNTITKSNYVVTATPPAPVAGFTGTPTNGYTPLQVVFSDASSGNITNWVWNFGNGHSITNTTSGEVTNLYAAVTNYTVTLKVTGLGGASTLIKTNYIVVWPVIRLGHPTLSDGRLMFSGTNGTAGQQYRILGSTNLVVWVPLLTNTFLNDGSYACTNLTATNHQGFFRLVTP